MAECHHRHMIETVKKLSHEASLSSNLWSPAFQPATYLINRLPTQLFNNTSPYEKKLVSHPDTIYLELFVVSVTHGLDLTPPISLSLDQFHVSISAYLKFIMCTNVLIPFTQNFVSRDVKFFENIFPFRTIFSHFKNWSFTLT